MQIEIKNLHKSYFKNNKEIKVLNDLNLTIDSGEFVSLTGPSGAGKSTLLHLIGTLDNPSSGEIYLDNEHVFEQSDFEISNFRNANIGFVFQFHHLLPEMTALENVMLPLWVRRDSKEKSENLAKKILEQVGLSQRVDHKPGELSGGEQQRVALARALVTNPKLLLADEPTGNLDEETGEAIFELIKNLSQENRFSVIFVTHNTNLAARSGRNLKLEL